MLSLIVNGATHDVDADPQMPLLWVLRDKLGLTGTKYACDDTGCGACSVLVDGALTKSCALPVGAADGSTISTVEGLAESEWEVLQRAFIDKQVAQCGYCQSGVLMATVALLSAHPHATRGQVHAAIDNLCPCGTYPRIEAAIMQVVERRAELRRQEEAEAKARAVAKRGWRRKAGLKR